MGLERLVESERARAAVLSPRVWVTDFLSRGPTLVVPVIVCAIATLVMARFAVAFWCAILLLHWHGLRRRVWTKTVPGRVLVGPHSLSFEPEDGEQERALRGPFAAWQWTHRGTVYVSFANRDRTTLSTSVPDATVAAQMLDAARRLPSRRALAPLQSAWDGRWAQLAWFGLLWLLAAFVLRRPPMPSALLAIGMAAIIGVLLTLRVLVRREPTWVEAGTDGLLLESAGRRRFVPFTDTREVDRVAQSVVVRLVSGASLALDLGGSSVSRRDSASERENLEQAQLRALTRGFELALRDSKDAFVDRLSSPLDFRRFRRAGRSLSEWRAALSSPASAYRSESPDHSTAQDVLADPTAPADARVGAALLLEASGQPEDVERIQIQADNTVEPRLRELLQGVAAGTLTEASLTGL
jgi:hypothetical protein